MRHQNPMPNKRPDMMNIPQCRGTESWEKLSTGRPYPDWPQTSAPGRSENKTPLRFTPRGVLLYAGKQKLRLLGCQGPLPTEGCHRSFGNLCSMSSPVIEKSATITCPNCGHSEREEMPTDACQFFYDCKDCGEIPRPLPGDCCVCCSYGDTRCPPVQNSGSCC